MPVRVKCPTGHQLIVPDSRCGTVVICPRCDQPLKVPPAKSRTGASGRITPPSLTEAAALEATRQLQASAAISTAPAQVPTEAATATPISEPFANEPPPPVISDPQLVLRSLAGKTPHREAEKPATVEPAAPPSPPRLRLFTAQHEPALPEPAPPKPPPLDPPRETLGESRLGELPAVAAPTHAMPEEVPRTSAESASIPEPATDTLSPPAPELPIEQSPTKRADAVAKRPNEFPSPEPPAGAALATQSITPEATSESPPLPEPPEPPPLPPPPPAPPPPAREGILHEPARLLVAWQVAGAMALVAIFSMCPALIDIVDHLRSEESLGVGRWAWAMLLVSLVQLAYAIYVSQLPDWTTLWVASLQSLATAAGYAAVLGFVVTSRSDHWLLAFLQLSDQLAGGRAALWCITMIAAMSLLAYFSGFASVRWHKAEMVMRSLATR